MSDTSLPAATIPPTGLRRRPGIWPMHSGVGIHRYFMMHAMGVLFPATAGWCLFGWRAVGTIMLTMIWATAATFIWRRIGLRGAALRYDQVLWLAGLLGLTLPADLFSVTDWPVLAGGAVIMVILVRLIQGVGWGKIHPVVLTHLFLVACFHQLLVPEASLQWSHIFRGDVVDAAPPIGAIMRPWLRADLVPGHDAVQAETSALTLTRYTTTRRWPMNTLVPLDALLRDHLPPLEDLLLGGQPAPIGLGSAIAVIVGGLFLLYHGMIDSRVPLVMVVSAMLTMLILPLPFVVGDDFVWHWFAVRSPGDRLLVLTLVNYEMLAGPLLFTAFFLAPSSLVRPIAQRARTLYALLAGILTGVFQLYLSVSVGAYLALLIVAAAAPLLDRFFKAHTLV
ncbi:MAG TPA: RnfABCDGE type electron transport complex subunit D [Tepidisphaeraceae bacterium]|nr:RnfABCDGE type electron transport complex subunit D [Tepidisphaeraceae bacterium]